MRNGLVILVLCCLLGCTTARWPEVLIGSWQSNVVETEWGEIQFDFTFFTNQSAKCTVHYETHDSTPSYPIWCTIGTNNTVRANVEKNRPYDFQFRSGMLWLSQLVWSESNSNLVEYTWSFRKTRQ